MKKQNLFALLLTYLIAVHVSANELKLHIISAPKDLNWNSVNGMLISTVDNTLGKKAKAGYFIGHFAVEIKCDRPNEFGINHVLTGMSRANGAEGNKIIRHGGYGLGALFYPFAGTLDTSSELTEDFEKLKELGRYQSVTIPTSAGRCEQMLNFMKSWIENGSYTVYGGGKDVENGEGSGCADFAEAFYKIASGKSFPEGWIIEKKVPLKLIGTEEQRVSLFRLLLRKKWAKPSEDFVTYRTPDPTIAFNSVKSGFSLDKGDSETDLIESDVQLSFKYPTKLDPTEVWNSIKLDN